jgi:hypothetical protein
LNVKLFYKSSLWNYTIVSAIEITLTIRQYSSKATKYAQNNFTFCIELSKKSYFYEHIFNYNLTEKISFHGLHDIKKLLRKLTIILKKVF